MGYLTMVERDARLGKVREILAKHDLDLALIYYDEFNIANAWYLSGWCPQFESGAVLVPREGEPMILGGPESEPFAKLDSAIRETRNLPCFMVPEEEYPNATIIGWPEVFAEVNSSGTVRRAGLVNGDRMPMGVYRQIADAFKGVELVDITDPYTELRSHKSPWELENIRKAFALTDGAIEAMRKTVKRGATELEVAAAGEFAGRSAGGSGFGFTAIVGSGARSNSVVPTASDKVIEDGELVMLGISPKWKGYAGVAGDTVRAGRPYNAAQKECMKHLSHAFQLTKEQLVPGKIGKELFEPGRAYYAKLGWERYIVCPFAHTIGLNEAEAPFYGPRSTDVLEPGMAVCVDVSFFGHPEFHGVRIETGYEVSHSGPVPMSPSMDRYLCEEIGA